MRGPCGWGLRSASRPPTSRVKEVGPAAFPEEASVLQILFWGLGEPGLCQVHELICHMTVCQKRRGTELVTGAAPRPNGPQGPVSAPPPFTRRADPQRC